jgi:hypothetical protein
MTTIPLQADPDLHSDQGSIERPGSTMPRPRRTLVWTLLVLFMGSLLVADLLQVRTDDRAFGLSVATFLMGASGTSQLPPGLEYRRAWSSRIGATVPARAWMELFSSPDGIRVDSARTAMALWGGGLLVVVLLVLLLATGRPLVPCLVLISTLWVRAWQHLPDGDRIEVHYAWDLPAMLVFAVVLVLMLRRHEQLGLAIAAIGISVKLTSGVWILAIPWVSRWSWRRRLGTMAGFGTLCLLVKLACDLASGNRLLLTPNAVGPDGTSRLVEHLAFLGHPSLVHPLFLGGGLVLAAVLCASRRHAGLVTVMVGFVAGQLLFSEPGEYRVFLEILPVAALIVAERAQDLTPG